MKIKPQTILIAGLFTFMATVASAQTSRDIGRYTMQKVDGGFIRLDTQTGAISVCRQDDDKWSCALAPDDAKKLQAEIKLLEDEVRALRDENRLLKGQLDDRYGKRSERGSEPPDPRTPPSTFRLPSEKEVDKALDYFENMLRKFQERLKRLEQGKGTGSDGENKRL